MANYDTMSASEVAGALKFAAILCEEEKLFPGLSGLLVRAAKIVATASEETIRVVLTNRNFNKKIQAIKATREVLGMALKDAKDAVENGEVVLFEGPESEAMDFYKNFQTRWRELDTEVRR